MINKNCFKKLFGCINQTIISNEPNEYVLHIFYQTIVKSNYNKLKGRKYWHIGDSSLKTSNQSFPLVCI